VKNKARAAGPAACAARSAACMRGASGCRLLISALLSTARWHRCSAHEGGLGLHMGLHGMLPCSWVAGCSTRAPPCSAAGLLALCGDDRAGRAGADHGAHRGGGRPEEAAWHAALPAGPEGRAPARGGRRPGYGQTQGLHLRRTGSASHGLLEATLADRSTVGLSWAWQSQQLLLTCMRVCALFLIEAGAPESDGVRLSPARGRAQASRGRARAPWSCARCARRRWARSWPCCRAGTSCACAARWRSSTACPATCRGRASLPLGLAEAGCRDVLHSGRCSPHACACSPGRSALCSAGTFGTWLPDTSSGHSMVCAAPCCGNMLNGSCECAQQEPVWLCRDRRSPC